MSAAIRVPAVQAEAHTIVDLPEAATGRAAVNRLRERGMATVEYAMGVVVVLVVIGVVVVALKTGTFQGLIENLLKALVGWVSGAFGLELPIKI